MADIVPARLSEIDPSGTRVLPPLHYRRAAAVALDLSDMEPASRSELEWLHRQTEQDAPAVTHHVFADAVVAGQGTVVVSGGRMVFEAAFEFLGGGRAPDGFARTQAGGFTLTSPVMCEVAAPSLLAKRPWAVNYGHFLVDAAALVALADRLALPHGWQIVITRFGHERLRALARELLGVLAPGVPVVEQPNEETWRFAQLHYISPVQIPRVMLRPEGLAVLRSTLLRPTRARPAASRRLFVSRSPHFSRALENEAEIAAICRARGFEVVRPELDPITEQAALFRQAAFVVGVKGAAMTNLMFAPAGSTALLLTPADFPDPFFWDICGHMGVRYAEMAGPLTSTRARGSGSLRIDPARFTALLDRLLAG